MTRGIAVSFPFSEPPILDGESFDLLQQMQKPEKTHGNSDALRPPPRRSLSDLLQIRRSSAFPARLPW